METSRSVRHGFHHGRTRLCGAGREFVCAGCPDPTPSSRSLQRQLPAAASGFNQEIRKNGDGGFAFDYALGGGEFIEQRGLGYAEFHGLAFLTCGTGCRHVAFPR